jgi:DMSO/TMAO reductase YedYZ molybdopterin-dependent catalytic subunit
VPEGASADCGTCSRSGVSLDGAGEPEPYYLSIDLETARHPQALLATHYAGAPLTRSRTARRSGSWCR